MDKDDVVDVLNDLLETSHDGEYGFATCADKAESPTLKQVLRHRAEQCRMAAEEMAQLIQRLGGEPAEGGTSSGAMHRSWVQLKGAVGPRATNRCSRNASAGRTRPSRATARR